MAPLSRLSGQWAEGQVLVGRGGLETLRTMRGLQHNSALGRPLPGLTPRAEGSRGIRGCPPGGPWPPRPCHPGAPPGRALLPPSLPLPSLMSARPVSGRCGSSPASREAQLVSFLKECQPQLAHGDVDHTRKRLASRDSSVAGCLSRRLVRGRVNGVSSGAPRPSRPEAAGVHRGSVGQTVSLSQSPCSSWLGLTRVGGGGQPERDGAPGLHARPVPCVGCWEEVGADAREQLPPPALGRLRRWLCCAGGSERDPSSGATSLPPRLCPPCS